MDYETTYTILLQEEKFTLSQSQIEFDSPNYFTMCFLGDFREAQTRSVQLTRSPEIFPLIRKYLCGYMILPLSDYVIPKGMTATQTIANLRADALFYQLEGLVEQCDVYLEPVKKGLPASHRYLLVGWEVSKSKPVDIRSLNVGEIGEYVPTPKQLGWHLYVTKHELEKLAFKNMMVREEFIKGGAEGIYALTTVICVVDKILPRDARRRWVVDVHLNKYGDMGKEEEEVEDEGQESEDEAGDEDSEDDGENEEVVDEDDSSEEGSVDDEEDDRKFDGFDGEIIVIMLEE